MRPSARVVSLFVLAIGLLCCTPNAAKAQAIEGDLNDDGFVGAQDLQIILSNWGQIVPIGEKSRGDLFPDGFVGLTDLSFLLLSWGQGTIPTPGGDASLGMNLSEIAYFSRELVFVDAVKSARRWVRTNPNGQPFDTGGTVVTDANGWPILQPGQSAQTILLSDKPANYPAGTYTVTFDGSGTLEFDFDASNAQVTGSGTMTFNVGTATDNGILMRIETSNPANHVRNIRVWMPGYDANSPSSFHPDFTSKLAPFGVIRFMDWQQTNGSNVVEFEDMSNGKTFSLDNGDGVALKYMIELCNQLDADAWFCMPHKASDAFVTQFATAVRDGLPNADPDLAIPALEAERKIYVEWSNEVWNVSFPQQKWVTQQSGAKVFADAWFEKWAEEAKKDFDIWAGIFAANPNRLIRVAAGQQANVWVTRRLTEELDAISGDFDAIACGAYFDERHAPFNASTTPQDIIDNAYYETIPNTFAGQYQNHGDLAQQLTNNMGKTIPLLAYEGGQHYTVHGNSSRPYFQAFKDVQTYEHPVQPDMYDAYTLNLEAFNNGGGSLYMAYSFVSKPGPFGAWGHLQFQNETGTQAPKYRALLDFNSE